MTKMTYAMALEIAINAVAEGEIRDKLIALKAQIEKKNSAERKPTKAQVANDALAHIAQADIAFGTLAVDVHQTGLRNLRIAITA